MTVTPNLRLICDCCDIKSPRAYFIAHCIIWALLGLFGKGYWASPWLGKPLGACIRAGFHLIELRGLPLLGATTRCTPDYNCRVAAGRAAAAWAEWLADSKQDSSSLFLGGRIGDGFGVF